MTDALYMKDCYLKEWDAKIAKVEGVFVVLDKCAFYPESGGQISDTGILKRGDDVFKVLFAKKLSGDISLQVDKEGLSVGEEVHCMLDWERRHMIMRYHTAAHIISTLINNETGAKVTGNQLNLDKGRIDYDLENYDKELIMSFESKVNEIVAESRPVSISIMPREEAFKIPALVKLKMMLPETITEIRVVDIKDFDQQACAGTHVRNTAEIGKVRFTGTENKGKNKRRLYFVIE